MEWCIVSSVSKVICVSTCVRHNLSCGAVPAIAVMTLSAAGETGDDDGGGGRDGGGVRNAVTDALE